MKPHLFQVLLALADQDRHGLEIMRDVLERTDGQVHLWPGMLYGALKELVEMELAVEKQAPPEGKAGGGKPRYYGITERGRKALALEAERLERYVQAARVAKPLEAGRTARMRRIYRFLLRRLPPAFLALYGTEMEEAFLESLAITRRRWRLLAAPYSPCSGPLGTLHRLERELRPRASRNRRLNVTDGFFQDLRLGARRLLRAPAFTVASVATLGLGIGAVTIMLTLVDAILVRPLPYAESDRLMALFLHEKATDARRAPTSPVNFHALRAESETLSLVTAAHPWSPTFTGGDRPDELHGLKASPSLFQLLGAQPLLGRVFDERDEGEDRVVVLGYDLWRRRFGQDPSLVGKTIVLDNDALRRRGCDAAGVSLSALLGHRCGDVGASDVHPRGGFRPLAVSARLRPARARRLARRSAPGNGTLSARGSNRVTPRRTSIPVFTSSRFSSRWSPMRGPHFSSFWPGSRYWLSSLARTWRT